MISRLWHTLRSKKEWKNITILNDKAQNIGGGDFSMQTGNFQKIKRTWASPQAAMTKGSLTATQMISLMPAAFNSSAFSM